jgi:anti-anti-sigma factor
MRMTQYASFKINEMSGVPCVEIIGAIDIGNIEGLEAVLQDAASRDVGVVVISFEGAEYFDSRTVHALAQYLERMRTNRQKIHFVLSKGSKVRLLLDITGLLTKMRIFQTLSEAVAAAVPLLHGNIEVVLGFEAR